MNCKTCGGSGRIYGEKALEREAETGRNYSTCFMCHGTGIAKPELSDDELREARGGGRGICANCGFKHVGAGETLEHPLEGEMESQPPDQRSGEDWKRQPGDRFTGPDGNEYEVALVEDLTSAHTHTFVVPNDEEVQMTTALAEFEREAQEGIYCGELITKQDDTSIEKYWCMSSDLCPDCTLKFSTVRQAAIRYGERMVEAELEALGPLVHPHDGNDEVADILHDRLAALRKEEGGE